MERPTVSSRQNPLVKSVCGLTEKKRRTESGLFRFDGVKLLQEAILSGLKIKHIIYREPMADGISELISLALERGCAECDGIVAVTDSVFEKLSDERSPEGVITVAYFPSQLHSASDAEIPRNERILIAEALRDPGNLGTVIRSAYALGIDVLVITDDCADIYNPKTLRAAMGAAFRLSVRIVKKEALPTYIKRLRESGRRVFAAALSEASVSIRDLSLRAGDCFVIGNEGHGLTRESISACDMSVIIPMREDAESLNAAAAAAICIWETVKA